MTKMMATKDASLQIFGNDRSGTRQRIVRMVKGGWLRGHQIEDGHNSPFWISAGSVERYLAAIEEGGAAIARLKKEIDRDADAA